MAPRGRRPVLLLLRRRLGSWLLGLGGLALAALTWQLLSLALASSIFPTFSAAVADAWSIVTGPVLTADLVPSVLRTAVGFSLSGVAGIIIGLAVGYYRLLRELTSALFDFFRSLPTPLLVPVFIVLFGLGGTMVVAVIVTAAIWPVLINTANGTAGLDPTMLDTARVCGLRGPSLLGRVILPAVSPQIFAGLRVAISVSLAVMVVAEILGGSSGIGYFINNAQQAFQITDSYAGILLLCVLGWLFDSLFLLVERRLLAWQRGTVGGEGDA